MSILKKMKHGARWSHVLLWSLLATVVALPLMSSAKPRAGEALRYGYKTYNYAAIIARCQGRCNKKKVAIFACIGRDQKLAMKNCRTDLKTCNADPACKADAKPRLRLCMQSARGPASADRRAAGAGPCNKCCRRSKGGGDCLSYFSGSRLSGSYRYQGRLNCVEGAGGDGAENCLAACDREAAEASRQCGRGKAFDSSCLARVEAQRIQCRMERCGETTTTTTTFPSFPPTTLTFTTTTFPSSTSTTLPGDSPECAALNCDQYDDFCTDYSCIRLNLGFTVYASCTSTQKEHAACDDGNACNGQESFDCATGSCQHGPPPQCEQYSDLCTKYTCTSAGGSFTCSAQTLSHSPCDDGNACNGYEYFDCKTGCTAGAGDPCAVYNNFCVHSECTSINNSPSCSFEQLPQPTCSDGDACNGTETFDCQTGQCVDGPPVFCPSGRHCVNGPSGASCTVD